MGTVALGGTGKKLVLMLDGPRSPGIPEICFGMATFMLAALVLPDNFCPVSLRRKPHVSPQG